MGVCTSQPLGQGGGIDGTSRNGVGWVGGRGLAFEFVACLDACITDARGYAASLLMIMVVIVIVKGRGCWSGCKWATTQPLEARGTWQVFELRKDEGKK